MSYENDLTSNNTDLQSILDTINALPEVGIGKLTRTVTVTGTNYWQVLYFDTNGSAHYISNNGQTVEALGGILVLDTNFRCMRITSGDAYVLDRDCCSVAYCREDGVNIDATFTGGGEAID